jgi:predicted alpha/beta hydrolase family esterase
VGRLLIFHGLDGSGAGHWQRWLEPRLREHGEDVSFPELSDPSDPQPEAWVREARLHLGNKPSPQVICHSLACLLWLRLAARAEERLAERVLLVAPPWREDVPAVARFLDHGAGPEDVVRACPETTMICSDDDPYCPGGALERYSQPLAIPCDVIAGAGHINTEAGFGPWPAAEEWALA